MHKPHRGSMQFWPHKRAKRAYARVRTWLNRSKDVKLLAFPGYKAGMTHILLQNPNPNSPAKGMQIQVPVTVLECPPLRVYSIRYYKKGTYGTELVGEVFAKKYDKSLSRKVKPSKKDGKEPEDYDDVRVVVYTLPVKTGLEKKKPELMEIGIGGTDPKQKAEFAKSLLDKEVRLSEVFKEGHLVDVHAVTKGKGFQGTVKKFGVKILQHKSEKKKRGIGNLGSWTPKKVQFTVAQPGKFGFHLRTEYNKLLLKLGDKPEEINVKGGYLHYGNIKNDYVLIKGSVPGHVKRLVTITDPIRPRLKFKPFQPEIKYLSLESKQG